MEWALEDGPGVVDIMRTHPMIIIGIMERWYRP
jgi:hypothetical protein